MLSSRRTLQVRSLPLGQILFRRDEALDAAAALEGVDDGGHVGDRDAAVEEVVRLHQHGDARRALIEAARRAGASALLGETASSQLRL